VNEACQLCPARIAQSATNLLGVSLGEIVPPEAQRHLMNAQRELLLALLVTIDHNATRVNRSPAKSARKRRAKAAPRRPKRVDLE
jgi:hypothetical protein